MIQKSVYFNDILRQTLHEKADLSLFNDILKQTLHEKADFSFPREKSLCPFNSGHDFVKTIVFKKLSVGITIKMNRAPQCLGSRTRAGEQDFKDDVSRL